MAGKHHIKWSFRTTHMWFSQKAGNRHGIIVEKWSVLHHKDEQMLTIFYEYGYNLVSLMWINRLVPSKVRTAWWNISVFIYLKTYKKRMMPWESWGRDDSSQVQTWNSASNWYDLIIDLHFCKNRADFSLFIRHVLSRTQLGLGKRHPACADDCFARALTVCE